MLMRRKETGTSRCIWIERKKMQQGKRARKDVGWTSKQAKQRTSEGRNRGRLC